MTVRTKFARPFSGIGAVFGVLYLGPLMPFALMSVDHSQQDRRERLFAVPLGAAWSALFYVFGGRTGKLGAACYFCAVLGAAFIAFTRPKR